MRMGLIIAGILIAAVGIASVMGKFSVTQDKEVAKVGDLSASVPEKHALPPWLGITVIVIGGVLIVGGAARKT